MCFRVEHEFKGIHNKPETIIMPQMLTGQWSKTNHWKPVVCELVDEVDANSATQISEKLREAEELGQTFVPFFIHSNGGEVYALMSIVESMKRCKVPIYTYVSGYAASCAACIFSCGTRRFMSRNARLLIHDVSVDFSQESNMTSSNLKTEAKEMRNLNKTIFQIMAENAGHPSNFFINLVKNKRNNDIYVDAAQALEWKLATDIGYPVVKVSHETTMKLDFLPDTVAPKEKTKTVQGHQSTSGLHSNLVSNKKQVGKSYEPSLDMQRVMYEDPDTEDSDTDESHAGSVSVQEVHPNHIDADTIFDNVEVEKRSSGLEEEDEEENSEDEHEKKGSKNENDKDKKKKVTQDKTRLKEVRGRKTRTKGSDAGLALPSPLKRRRLRK